MQPNCKLESRVFTSDTFPRWFSLKYVCVCEIALSDNVLKWREGKDQVRSCPRDKPARDGLVPPCTRRRACLEPSRRLPEKTCRRCFVRNGGKSWKSVPRRTVFSVPDGSGLMTKTVILRLTTVPCTENNTVHLPSTNV